MGAAAVTNIITRELDVVLLDGETVEQLLDLLNERLQASVTIAPTSTPAGPTFLVTGTEAQVRAAFAWRATTGTTRDDLHGRPPVPTGARRTIRRDDATHPRELPDPVDHDHDPMAHATAEEWDEYDPEVRDVPSS